MQIASNNKHNEREREREIPRRQAWQLGEGGEGEEGEEIDAKCGPQSTSAGPHSGSSTLGVVGWGGVGPHSSLGSSSGCPVDGCMDGGLEEEEAKPKAGACCNSSTNMLKIQYTTPQ
jgi:hypothetical protein